MQACRNGKGSDFYAPYGTCRKCGWTGKDWGFKYHGYCKKCHTEWRKEKAEERRRLKPPNVNIEVADGIVVTRNVQIRLKRQAQYSVQRTGKEIFWDFVTGLAVLMSMIAVLMCLLSVALGALKLTLFFGACVTVSLVIYHKTNPRLEDEIKKRTSKVDAHLEGLARERQRQIDETRAFYASPEWRLVREQVIREQGRHCQECHSHITEDSDVTVDHIKPRSKFPKLALEKSNLQVLCRRCNSAKGATYNEASITNQATS